MTPRERVKAALERREGDRVPIDLGGTESSSLHVDAYAGLCKLIGVDDRPSAFDVYQQISFISNEIRERFSIDTAPLAYGPQRWREGITPAGKPAYLPERWQDEPGADGARVVRNADGVVTASMPAGGFYFDEVSHPLANVSEPSELDAHGALFEAFDKPAFLDEGWDSMSARARRLHNETDYCVVANLCMHVLAAGESLRGFENFMMDLVADQRLAFALMEKLLEAYMRRIDVFAEKVAPWVDVVLVTDDLGSQAGPLISPELYRATVKKYHRELFGYVKKSTGKPLLFHSCGSVHDFIGDLIEIGVDALNPVQVSAAGMNTARLKHDFGSEITFWGGGCDTQNVLGRGTPRDVRDEVKRRIDDLAPGGSFVFTQVHNIQPNVPARNIVAMLEAAAEFGGC